MLRYNLKITRPGNTPLFSANGKSVIKRVWKAGLIALITKYILSAKRTFEESLANNFCTHFNSADIPLVVLQTIGLVGTCLILDFP